jgi:bifunctional non-homologous end joining protein LigD
MAAMRPMLATPADPDKGLPPDGERWAYEVKWDGMRVLADIHDGAVQLHSRTERDITVSFPELAALGSAHPDVLLDGEIVVLADGIPSFAALADRIHVREPRRAAALATRAPATLIAFDALRLYGVDLTGRPWQERRDALERLRPSGGKWQLSPVHEDLESLLSATVEHGLEGVVAKRRSSTYRPGARSSDWLKLAHRRTQSCVIGGWRPETGDANRIGALMLGVWVDPLDGSEAWVDPKSASGGSASGGSEPPGRRLRFAGRVGSGLVGDGPQADLHRLLRPLALDRSPFDDVIPREDAVGTKWVQPQVVVEVRHLGHTDGGRLRQPVFRGIRADVDPDDVRDE